MTKSDFDVDLLPNAVLNIEIMDIPTTYFTEGSGRQVQYSALEQLQKHSNIAKHYNFTLTVCQRDNGVGESLARELEHELPRYTG